MRCLLAGVVGREDGDDAKKSRWVSSFVTIGVGDALVGCYANGTRGERA